MSSRQITLPKEVSQRVVVSNYQKSRRAIKVIATEFQ
jgi:hypothetical protein